MIFDGNNIWFQKNPHYDVFVKFLSSFSLFFHILQTFHVKNSSFWLQYPMIMHNKKENHISNKDDLVWGQYRYSKSIILLFAPGWITLTLLFYIKIAIFGGNLGTFQNDVEAKPFDQKCWNFAKKNRSWYAFTQKNPNFEIEIVFTQYNFCWLQLLLKTGYVVCSM